VTKLEAMFEKAIKDDQKINGSIGLTGHRFGNGTALKWRPGKPGIEKPSHF
jgi:hypothetical protein